MIKNLNTKFISLLAAFLMLISVVSFPTVTAFADDSQPEISQPADTQPSDTPPPESQTPVVLSSDCSLASLTLSGGPNNYEVLPAISADVTVYTANVGADTGSVTVTALSSDPLAKVTGNTGAIDLSVGDNSFKIIVTAQDGTTKTYTLTVTRTKPEAAVSGSTATTMCNPPSSGNQGFEIDNKGTYIIITGYDGDEDTVTIPAAIDNIPVTGIGKDAFSWRCMSAIVLPDSITDIGACAFYGCSKLSNITFGSGLKNIGDYAFKSCCGLGNINLPESLEKIGDGAFSECDSLININITKNVKSIGNMFLYGCGNLESITANGNANFTVQDGILYTSDKKTLIICPPKRGSSCGTNCEGYSKTIPDSVETISDGAFSDCSNLESISLDNKLVKIGDYAFQGCWSLSSMTLPASLASVSGLSFAGCPIKEFKVAEGNSTYVVKDKVLYSGNKLVAFPGAYWSNNVCEKYSKIVASGDIKTRNSIKTLCYDNNNNNAYTVPDSVDEIGRGAFAECSITDIVFGSGVKKIDDSAFYGCGSLQIVNIPNNVSSLEKDVFEDCCSLVSVTFGSGLQTLSPLAIDNCCSLGAIYFLGDAPSVEINGCDKAFPGSGSNLKLYYASGKSGYGSPTWLGIPTVPFDPTKTFTVTYNYNDGSTEPYRTLSVFSGGRAVDFYPYSESCNKFLGWYEDTACTNPWYFDTETVKSNVSLYACWTTEKNAFLDGLCIKGGDCDEISMSPEFDSNVFSYMASLSQSQDSFTLSADANYDCACVYIDGKAQTEKEYTLKQGQGVTCTVTVKTANQKKQYTVIVTKGISSNADLKYLTAKSGGNVFSLDQSFDPNVTDYNLRLNEDTSSVTIYAGKDDSASKVSIDGKSKSSKKYKLNPGGKATSKITVAAKSKYKKTYSVNIKRDSDTDVNLSSLKTNLKKYGITPRFNRDTVSYEIYLPENIGSILLSAKAEGYGAGVLFTNTGTKAASKGSMKVNVGNGGAAQIDIKVISQASTADNPIAKDYTVMIYRASKITGFSASPKSGAFPTLSTGGENKLKINWAQAGDGNVNIEACVKEGSKRVWKSIYTGGFEDGSYSYDWNGQINGEYLSPGKYKVRISVSYKSDGFAHSLTSTYKVLNVKIVNAT